MNLINILITKETNIYEGSDKTPQTQVPGQVASGGWGERQKGHYCDGHNYHPNIYKHSSGHVAVSNDSIDEVLTLSQVNPKRMGCCR